MDFRGKLAVKLHGVYGIDGSYGLDCLSSEVCLLVFLVAPMQKSGQIIATSHDLTPNGGLVREIPYFREI